MKNLSFLPFLVVVSSFASVAVAQQTATDLPLEDKPTMIDSDAMPPAVLLVVTQFKTALSSGDWNEALRLSSERVRNAGKNSPSPEVFLKSVVPVKLIAEDKVVFFPTLCTVTSPGVFEVRFTLTVPLQPASNLQVTWHAKVVHEGTEWRIDFEPLSIDEQLKKILTSRSS
jgi:hypothetical protein